MLPDLRFLLGATLATALLGVVALGLATTVRLSHQAKISPLEASRSLAYAERSDFSRSADPELTRTFEALARTSAGSNESAVTESTPTPALAPVPQTVPAEPANAQPEMEAVPQEATASVPSPETANTQQPAAETAQPEPSGAPQEASIPRAESASRAGEPTVTAEQTPSDHTVSTSAATPSPEQPGTTASASPQATRTQAAPTVEPAAADTTRAATIMPFEAPSAQASAVQASGPTATPQTNDDVEQVASVRAAAIPNAAQEQVEERDVDTPQAEPAPALQQPAPKVRRAIHVRASKTKAPKTKIAKAKPKAAVRARTAARQPEAWTGYPMTPQRPTSWGWGFNK